MIGRALTHASVPMLSPLVAIPAFFLANTTERASLAVVFPAGLLVLWNAYAWATNRYDAWDRVVRLRLERPGTWALLTGTFGKRRPVPEGGADERAIPVLALSVWGLALMVAGTVG